MTPDPQHRISDLYHRASLLRPDERDAFLRHACPGDDAVRAEVEDLLRFESGTSRFLETPAMVVAEGIAGAEPALVAGDAIGPYSIVAPLGAGGMGQVYRAIDGTLGREVAIKILPAPLAADPERRARFTREARMLAALNHPNIGAIYGLESAGHVTALVLELVEGPTLAEYLVRGPLPVRRAIAVARQIAEALDAAHEKGIVHRDLKPANIVVQGVTSLTTGEVRAKVLDFGVAKSMTDAPTNAFAPSWPASPDTTAAGRVLGTPAYMSPEQARGLPLDKRSDVWAFGCVLFEMLSGVKAFDGETTTETLARVLEHDPDWSALPATVPPAIRRLLRRCLEKDSARRLRDMGDAAADLADGDTPESTVGTATAAPRRRASRVVWIALAALPVAAATAWWVAARSTTVSTPALHLAVDLGPEIALGSDATESGLDRAVGIAPDGQQLVLLANGQLMTRRLGQDATMPLPGTRGASNFFFAPDSRSVAFVVGRQLKRVELADGSVTTISDELPRVRGGTWARDAILLGGTRMGEGLLRVPVAGGRAEPVLTLAPGEVTQRWPQYLPGADAVIFTSHAYPAQFDRARIEVVSLATGVRKTLLTGASFGRFVESSPGKGRLLFARGGTLLAVDFDPIRLEVRGSPSPLLENVAADINFGSAQVDVSSTGTLVYRSRPITGLTVLERAGSARALPVAADSDADPDLSPDGSRVAFVSDGEIWLYDFERSVRRRLTEGISPCWTPDGRFIVFGTLDTLWWIRADGGAAPRALLAPKGAGWRIPTGISQTADGYRLAFQEITAGDRSWDLWTAPLRIDASGLHASPPEIFLVTRHDERHLQLSPDGRWAAYESDEAGARRDVHVRAFPDDGRRWTISDGGGTRPHWSAPRSELLFQNDGRILAAHHTVGAGGFVAERPRSWSPQPITKGDRSSFAVFPDGRRVVAPVQDEADERRSRHVVTLWTNALDEFRRRASAASAR